MPQNEIKCGDR